MRDDDRVLEIGGTLQQRLTSCLEVLDGFLAQTHAVVASMVVAEKRAGAGDDDLVTTMATMLGFRDLKQLSMESTLAELGMDSMMAVEIQQTLARDFDILLSPQDVRALTFGRLREYQRAKEAKEKKARAAPVASSPAAAQAATTAPAQIDPSAALTVDVRANLAKNALRQLVKAFADELTASNVVVPLASNLSNDVAIRDAQAIMFPGVEGVAVPLEPLARGLSIKSVALQLPFRNLKPAVPEMVDSLFQHVKEQLRGAAGDATSNGYVLLGYSYGGLLALEAAARLEAEGVGTEGMGRLVLLDAAPDLLRAMVAILVAASERHKPDQQQEKAVSDNEEASEKESVEEEVVQLELLTHVMHTMAPEMSPMEVKKLQEDLLAKKCWDARLRFFAEHTLDTEHSLEYKMTALNAIYSRIISAWRYRWPKDRPRLQASVTLIRPATSAIPPGIVPEDGGLSQICERPVRVHYVEGADHYTLPSKRQTAALVNAALEAAHKDLGSDFKANINGPDANIYHGLKSLH